VPPEVYIVRLFVAVNVIVVEAVAFELPVASVMRPAATVMTAGPDDERTGVKVAVYVVPDPEKLVMVPNVTEMSEASNVVTDSETLNVIVDVWPVVAETDAGDAVMVTVGGVASTVIDALATAERLPAVSTA
jgi:hypothetical protein